MDKGLSSAYKSPNVSNRYSSYATSDAGSTSSHHSASMGSSKGANASFRPSIMSSMKMQEQELRSESPLNAAFQLNASRSFNTFGDYLKNPRSIAPYDASQIPYQNRVKMASESECSDKKEKILKDLKKVEEEIEKTETAIKHKRIQKKELQDNIKNPANPSEKEKEEINEEEDLEPWQEIYAANRRQAAKSHAKGLSFLNPALTETGLGFRGILPQYNQPFDSARIQKLQVEMKAFKPRLLAYMSRKKRLEKKRDTIMSKKYDEDLKKWTLATERKMNSSRIRAMAQRHRECFEKMFPDLKKQRENQERLKRTANRESARSEAELNEVMESLQAKENRLKKMKQQAVVVPPLLSADERRFQVLDTTGRIDDPVELYKETCKDNPVWTEKEKAAFKREYVNHPKQWHIISSLIPGGKKTVSDCVKYYYSSKKKEEYKKLVRASKRKLAPGRHPKKRPDPALAANTDDQLTATKTRFGRKTAIWKEEEVESFKNAFRKFGESWSKVSEAVCRVPKSNRDAEACKNFFKNIGTCRKYKLKDVLKEHLTSKEVKKEAKEEPEETFDEKSKVKDEPVSPPKPASSSSAPGTPPTSSQKGGSPLTSKFQPNSVSPKALELFLPAGVSLPSNSKRSESPKSASGWTPGKPGSRPTTPVASRVGSAAVSPIVLPVPINVAAIPSRPSTPSQKSAQSQDIKVPQVEDQEKSSISMPSASSKRASNLFKPQQTTDARATGSPSPRTGSPAVVVGSQQKASQKLYASGKPGSSEVPLYQKFFSPAGYSVQALQQYPASATLVRGVYQPQQQMLPHRTLVPRATMDPSQAQQASHRVLDFADGKNQQPSGAQPVPRSYSVESLINLRQRIAPKTEADFTGQHIISKPTDSPLSYQNFTAVQPKPARRVSECPLQMLAQAAEDAGRAETAKKRKEDEKRAADTSKKEKELELQRVKQLQEKKKQDAIKAEQERQAEFRRQKMEEARLLDEARKLDNEKKEVRRREEAAKVALEAEAKQKALREKQIAEEKRQRAIKDAERKAAEKRKLEEERKRQQRERAQLQALLEQKRREQKEAEEHKRRKIEEQEEKRRKREREERERAKLKQKQLEEEARKAKEISVEQTRKLEEKLQKERAAKIKLAEEKEAKAKKEALERAKRDALRQIEEEEKKSAERQKQKKARERAARDLEADKEREAAKERESSKHNESTESASDDETDFVNLLYQTPSVSNVNQEVKIKFPASFELKRRNSDTVQSTGSSGAPVVNFIKEYPGKPPPDLSPKRPPDKNEDEEDAKRPPPEKKPRIKSPSPPPTSSPEENAATPEREQAKTPEKPTEVSIPEKPHDSQESETEDCSSKNLRGVTKSGDGSQGSASHAVAVSETPQAKTPPPAVVSPPPVTPPPMNLYGALSEAQQQSQTIVKMEPDSEGYGDYSGGCGNYDSCGNFLAEETAIIDLLCETSSSEDEEPAYFGSDTPDLTFSPVNEEVIDDEDDDEPLDSLIVRRTEAETASDRSESESESEAEPGTPEPRTPETRPSDESDNRATTPNAEATLPDPEPNVESSFLPVVPNLSSEENTSAIKSPSQLSKNVSRDDSSGASSPQPEKAASEANFNVLNLLADAALGNHHPPTTSKNLTNNSRPCRSESNEHGENLPDHTSEKLANACEHSSADPNKIDIENKEVTHELAEDIQQNINLEQSQSVELTQRKLEVCPRDNTSSFSVTHDQPHAFSNLSCDKKKEFSLEKEAGERDLEIETPVEEFKVPLSPHFVKEKTNFETSCATISTLSSVTNQYKILDQTKDSSVSKKTTPAALVGQAHRKNQEDSYSATTLEVQGHQDTEKPIERVILECEKESLTNQNSSCTNEVNKSVEMDLEIDESCLENAKLGLKKQEPGSFELRFSDSESVDSRPGSVLTSPSPHVYQFSDASSVDAQNEPAEEPFVKIVPEELKGSDDDESSAEVIDSESLFSNTKKESTKDNDLDDTLVEAEQTVLDADTTITETTKQEENKLEDETKCKPDFQTNSEIELFKDHEEIMSLKKPVTPLTLNITDNPGSDNLINKNFSEKSEEPKADKQVPKTITEDSCTSSNQDKKSSAISDVTDDIVAVSEPSALPPVYTNSPVPVPEVIKIAPSGPKDQTIAALAAQQDSVKVAEKSASKVKATKTFMPPIGFTPPFSQTVKRKLNIIDKEQAVPTGPVRKKMRVPLSQQPKTITQPRVQINPAYDFSQYHQTSIYQKPQSRYVKLQPAPANPSHAEERLLLARQRQLERLDLKHLEERRRLEANFTAVPRTSTSPLTIIADPSRHRRVTYMAEPARTIVQPQQALRQEQPIRPRLAAVQHIQSRAPIDPTRTFRPVQQASPTRPKQQIRCTFDLKLTNHGFRTLQRTTPSPTGQERVPIQRVIRISKNNLSSASTKDLSKSPYDDRPRKLS